MSGRRCGPPALTVVVLLALALVILFSRASTARATFPGRNGLIAFVADGRVKGVSGRGIAVIRPNGSGARLLTHNKDDASPSWSPDGTRLAFDRRGVIFTVKVDGAGLRRLTRGAARGHDPAWSPDGRRIIFVCGDALCVMRSDGRAVRRLSIPEVGLLGDPAWSPDGRWIAFGADDGAGGLVMVVSRMGGEPWAPTEGEGDDSQPDWSPDGSLLAFTRVVRVCEQCDVRTVWVTGADGTGGTVQITDDGENPSWAPDGKRLVATRDASLVVLDLSGGSHVIVPLGGSEPAWQPLPRTSNAMATASLAVDR